MKLAAASYPCGLCGATLAADELSRQECPPTYAAADIQEHPYWSQYWQKKDVVPAEGPEPQANGLQIGLGGVAQKLVSVKRTFSALF